MMVTARMAKRMQEMRAEGKTLLEIAAETGASITTVNRHTNPLAHEQQKKYERARYLRVKEDPEKWAAHMEKNRKYRDRYKASITTEGNN